MDAREPEAGRLRAAFERWREVIAAVPDAALVHINLDMMTTAMRAASAAKYIEPYRERAAMLPNFDITCFDRLEDYALAAMHAHTLYLAASPPKDELPALKKRAMAVRRRMRKELTMLIERGVIGDRLRKALSHGRRPEQVGNDLHVLVAFARDHWSVIADKTPIQLAELDEVEGLGGRLMSHLEIKSQQPDLKRAAAKTRAQAFALVVNAYDQVRRALRYFCTPEELKRIAPSLYRGRVSHAKMDALHPPD